jgi:hypothetical protein|tara:strand:+ start:1896 stop:2132 length:237 start_codon:yes stop_codon:yes gene_type:complete
MRIFNILGFIGVGSCVVFLIFWMTRDGPPDDAWEMWLAASLALVVCVLVPFGNIKKDSLLGLWIEAKKAKLRKEIDDN